MSLRQSKWCPNRQQDSPASRCHPPGGQPGTGPCRTMLPQTTPTQGSWEIETAWGNERQRRCLPVEPEPWREGTKEDHPSQLWHPAVCYLLHPNGTISTIWVQQQSRNIFLSAHRQMFIDLHYNNLNNVALIIKHKSTITFYSPHLGCMVKHMYNA